MKKKVEEKRDIVSRVADTGDFIINGLPALILTALTASIARIFHKITKRKK